MKIYAGIDCGVDGALVCVKNGEILCQNLMQTRKSGKRNLVDVLAVDFWLAHWKPDCVIIEDPGGHAPSATGLRSMSLAFAAIETVLIIREIPHHVFLSRTWQKEFWSRPKMPKGKKFDTKAAALLAASRLWPGHDWTKSERAIKPHDGIIDAALLAEYGRRKNL